MMFNKFAIQMSFNKTSLMGYNLSLPLINIASGKYKLHVNDDDFMFYDHYNDIHYVFFYNALNSLSIKVVSSEKELYLFCFDLCFSNLNIIKQNVNEACKCNDDAEMVDVNIKALKHICWCCFGV